MKHKKPNNKPKVKSLRLIADGWEAKLCLCQMGFAPHIKLELPTNYYDKDGQMVMTLKEIIAHEILVERGVIK